MRRHSHPCTTPRILVPSDEYNGTNNRCKPFQATSTSFELWRRLVTIMHGDSLTESRGETLIIQRATE